MEFAARADALAACSTAAARAPEAAGAAAVERVADARVGPQSGVGSRVSCAEDGVAADASTDSEPASGLEPDTDSQPTSPHQPKPSPPALPAVEAAAERRAPDATTSADEPAPDASGARRSDERRTSAGLIGASPHTRAAALAPSVTRARARTEVEEEERVEAGELELIEAAASLVSAFEHATQSAAGEFAARLGRAAAASQEAHTRLLHPTALQLQVAAGAFATAAVAVSRAPMCARRRSGPGEDACDSASSAATWGAPDAVQRWRAPTPLGLSLIHI